GSGRGTAAVLQVAELVIAEMRAQHAQVVAVVANRCSRARLEEMRTTLTEGTGIPAWALPDDAPLPAPTLRDVADAVHGELIAGDDELLTREVLDVIVGAMSVEHLLDRLADGAVVITPGDRYDVVLALLMAHQAEGFPSLAGIILNGGFRPPDSVS